jgi:hypothetical protein
MRGCEFRGLAKSNDGSDVLGAAASAVFLASSQPRGETHPTVDVEGSDPFGAMEFVSGEGKKLGAQLGDIERELAHGLDGIHVQGDFSGVGDTGDLFNGKKHAGFVIGPEEGDQGGVGPEGVREFLQIKLAGGIHGQPGDFVAAAGEMLAEFDRRAVFDGGGDYVGLVGVEGCGRKNGGIDRLGSATRENDLIRRAPDKGRDLLSGLVDGGCCPAPEGIHARWVSVFVAQPRGHGLKHGRIDLSGGVVVEVNCRLWNSVHCSRVSFYARGRVNGNKQSGD